MWYTRTEAQKRFSFFFSSTTLAGAFGGLLAYGISRMNGVGGYMGWRWVFIIEGLITCVAACILFFFMSDFPEEVKWLTDEERAFVRAKLARDVGKSAHHAKLGKREVLAVFKDCKSISRVIQSCCTCTDNLLQGRLSLVASCISALSFRHTVSRPYSIKMYHCSNLL